MADTTRTINADGTTTVTTTHEDGTTTTAIEPAKPKKVTFDADQQEHVNRLIDSAFGKAFEKANAAVEAKLAESQAKITELTTLVTSLKTPTEPVKPPKKDDKPNEELAQALARIAELNAAHQAVLAEKENAARELAKQKSASKETAIERAFLNGSRKIKFINPDQVLKLVKDEIDFDDELGQVVVKNLKTGRPKMDETLENPLTVEAFLSKWAEDNKNHVEATDAGGGTGAEESRRTPSTSTPPKSVDKMNQAEFQAYMDEVRMKSAR